MCAKRIEIVDNSARRRRIKINTPSLILSYRQMQAIDSLDDDEEPTEDIRRPSFSYRPLPSEGDLLFVFVMIIALMIGALEMLSKFA